MTNFLGSCESPEIAHKTLIRKFCVCVCVCVCVFPDQLSALSQGGMQYKFKNSLYSRDVK